ncbi:Gfo/Idh/MocA family protein [Feifania hominis]|uniref:Gfo/Idh/MocA family oxidoreductase n=1 Tax=Feifania hominis TaxID=2763660 RepID=A0A926DEV2_9FIRM|nr:Gfo/Idh/MocA family oxidoreductase [Feifania hominis]MBC8536911.1 Gfo/Idh/MocA family oxidoreductase [Feifania hominis]
MEKKINVGVAGLGFGGEFIPIYQSHPLCGEVAICTRNPKTLREIGDKFSIPERLRYTDYDEMVKNTELDAIHIVTPILEHHRQTLAALEAGKHTACTVPMATSLSELEDIVRAKKRAGKVYMMMETALYTREFLYVQDKVRRGEFGRLQFLRGGHMQNMALEGWGDYWRGFPPFYYGTHALSPLLTLLGTRAKSVSCHGSGRLSADKAEKYGSPFAVETATFVMENTDVVVEATRCLFETVRQVVESFDVYGDRMSFEWEQILDDGHVIFENIDDAHKIHMPETDHLLPEPIRKYARRVNISDPTQPSFIQGAGHGGSHPFVVDEFLNAIREDRDSAIDAVQAAQITGAGICAHLSAMRGGEVIEIPDFSKVV